MWIDKSVFYQIYPIGFCGAPRENDGIVVPRISKVNDWIEHLLKLNVNAVYFSPIFESDRHGYDTRDYYNVDCRLGTNEDFAQVAKNLHDNGIKIVLDGVFNHVGRGFWAFRDVLEKRHDSPYKDWFRIDFNGNSCYNDGFWYEGWEGHYELVKLNLDNPQVVEHIFGAISKWVELFDIDGLRLDVAYCINKSFLKQLRSFCNNLKPDFVLIGEILFGDYNTIVNDEMLHSCTNYECYKGLYSSFNSSNLFEISYSLNRQFGYEPWTLYKGKQLLCFADNHDVTRLSSILTDKEHIAILYGMLFSMPGIPCLYYGSEWGAEGEKAHGDDALRPCFENPQWNELTEKISVFAREHKNSKALCYGGYKSIYLTNKQHIFERAFEDETILIAINSANETHTAYFNANGIYQNLFTGENETLSGEYAMKPYSVTYFKKLNN